MLGNNGAENGWDIYMYYFHKPSTEYKVKKNSYVCSKPVFDSQTASWSSRLI